MDLPPIDSSSAADLLVAGQSKALEVSGGRLSDFTAASPVTAILEANAAIASQVIAAANNLAATLENNRLAIFQLDRQQGSIALGTATVTLDALYNVPFLLARGFVVSFGGVPFETLNDITIPAFEQSGVVQVGAVQIGSQGNLPATAIASFQTVPKLASITLVAATQGGLDEESLDEWKARIYGLLRRRDTLISVEDFQAEIVDYLGAGSTGLAIARLKPDKLNYANGYVGCFGLNPDGSALNAAQLADLSSYLNQKAAMATITLWSLDTFTLNLSSVVGFMPGVDPSGLAIAIHSAVSAYLKPGNLPPGQMILNKAIEYLIQNITGVSIGVIAVQINGYAQPQPLPSLWSVGVLGIDKIALTQNNQTFNYQF